MDSSFFTYGVFSQNRKHPKKEEGTLSSLIHLFVVLLVLTTSDIVHPCLVVEIPTDSFLYTLLKLQ